MTHGRQTRREYKRESVDTDGVIHIERGVEIDHSRHFIDFGSPYGTVSDAAWELMAILKFGAPECRLIGHFIRTRSRVDHGMVITGTNEKLQADVGMPHATFYRALTKLRTSGFIYSENAGSWQINPRWMFNGGGEAHFWALKGVPASVPDLFHLTSYAKRTRDADMSDASAAPAA